MFARNLPIIIVVLIVANPVFCQMRGFCEGVTACDRKECCDPCKGHGLADCPDCTERCDGPCQGQESPAKPCDCPDGSYCQCLRAGAVVKAGPSLDDLKDGLAPDQIAAVPLLAGAYLSSIPKRLSECFPPGKANPGRIARCLLMSFLC